MPSHDETPITRLLQSARCGASNASDELLPLVYDQLHQIANRIFADERLGHTLQPTALVHEAWVKLASGIQAAEDRHHFFVIASRAMRRVLTDHARRVKCQKRGDGRKRVTLDTDFGSEAGGTLDLLDLEDTLRRLGELNARHAQVVELRILGGLTIQEAAEALGVSHKTVENDWFMARAWLRRALAAT